MASEKQYPSPNAAQIGAGTGPFFQQSGEPAPIPDDLQQLHDEQLQAAANRTVEPSHQDYGQQLMQLQHEGHPNSTTPDAMAQGLAQGVLNMTPQHMAPSRYSPRAAAPEGERKKASQACDLCRRKKIKCEPARDGYTAGCERCKRHNVPCEFSREPQKRGPSKGYIKELADRLNVLENRVGGDNMSPHAAADTQQYLTNYPDDNLAAQLADYSSHSPQPISRKRHHSAVSDSNLYAKESQYAPANTFQPAEMMWRTQQETNVLRYTQPAASDVAASRQTQSAASETEVPRYTQPATSMTWDERIVDEYYRNIHPSLPFLPHSRLDLRLRLANVTAPLQNAFMAAMTSMVVSSPGTAVSSELTSRELTRRAAELLVVCQYDGSNTNMIADLVYVGALIFMTLATDNHGALNVQRQAGPTRSEWLARTTGVASMMRLHDLNVSNPSQANNDSDEALGRRIWWVLFVLNRWHGASMASFTSAGDGATRLTRFDQPLLGDNLYHIARMSYVLNHMILILEQNSIDMPLNTPAGNVTTTILMGELDRVMESADALVPNAPTTLHVAYQFVRLLILRLTSTVTAAHLLDPAVRIANFLNHPNAPMSPLDHHFASVAGLTLVQIREYELLRPDVDRGILNLLQAIDNRRSMAQAVEYHGWDESIHLLLTRRPSAINRFTRQGEGVAGLRHLANAASGRRQEDGAVENGAVEHAELVTQQAQTIIHDDTFDASILARSGYLIALSEIVRRFM